MVLRVPSISEFKTWEEIKNNKKKQTETRSSNAQLFKSTETSRRKEPWVWKWPGSLSTPVCGSMLIRVTSSF